MIRRFDLHAANERTFLSWTRTAIALVGFGVLIEKADLATSPQETAAAQAWSGLLLVVLGVLLVAVAGWRFVVLRRRIDSDTDYPAPSASLDILLWVVLSLQLASMCVYGLHVIVHIS